MDLKKLEVLGLLKFCIFSVIFIFVNASELTFEIPNNQEQCFYETLKANQKFAVDFQVIYGGNHDIDVTIKDPNGVVISTKTKSSFATLKLFSKIAGVYEACFNNENNLGVSHKKVYLDWFVPHEMVAPVVQNNTAAYTMVETSVKSIGEALDLTQTYQTHARNRESGHRTLAENLNYLVMLWSMAQTFVIILVGAGEVFVLRSFFTERIKSASNYSYSRN